MKISFDGTIELYSDLFLVFGSIMIFGVFKCKASKVELLHDAYIPRKFSVYDNGGYVIFALNN